MNGLLKSQLKRLGGGTYSKWVNHVSEAQRILNNRMLPPTLNPLNLMKGETWVIARIAHGSITVQGRKDYLADSEKGRCYCCRANSIIYL